MTLPPEPILLDQIKTLLRRDLKLGADSTIPDDMPLIGGEMDLDSLDILLLVSSVEKQFNMKIPSEDVGRWVFNNVSTLAQYVAANQQASRNDTVSSCSIDMDWLSRLPQGPAFRFVSEVIDVRPAQSARGAWKVNGDEPFFAAHFPGRPIVPGVLLIEALAQLAGLCVAPTSTDVPSDKQPTRTGMIAHVDVRFDRPVTPPARIDLNVTVTRSLGELLQCDVEASINGHTAARGSITLHLSEA